MSAAKARQKSAARRSGAARRSDTKQLRVRQTRSAVGYRRDQRATLRGLGLRRMGAQAELEDSDAVRGMLRKVAHLVSVEEV